MGAFGMDVADATRNLAQILNIGETKSSTTRRDEEW